MSNPKNPKLSLKVMINKQKTKILFAEAKGDFVDVLLSFLTLPLGKIVRTLDHHYEESPPTIGSLNTLYKGLYHLDSTHFSTKGAKEMFLNPRSSFEAECRHLVLDITDSNPTKHFVCQNLCCDRSQVANISMYCDIAECSVCGEPLNTETSEWESLACDVNHAPCVFTKICSCFLISDDLRVVPVEPGFLQTPAAAGVLRVLENLGVADTEGAEFRILNFGIDDMMDLLKLSLISAAPLTDLIIKNGEKGSTVAKFEPRILSRHAHEAVSGGSSKKMSLKVSLQRSTNKFLFAEATDEFLELLFSFLTVPPLRGVEFLLGSKTGLKNIDNLYMSITDFINDDNFATPNVKNRILHTKLAHGYVSDNQFLPLKEERPPRLCRREPQLGSTVVRSFEWSGGRGNYVKKPTMCYVTDDLTVTPSLASTVSILNGFGIALSDVKEMELHIGLEEALSILKASLTSKTALTDALINPMLHKVPKLEKER